MAFDAKGLMFHGPRSHGSYQVSVATYKTTDSIATVEANGYFDTMDDEFFTGDILHVSSSAGSNAGGERYYKVTATDGDIALAQLNQDLVALTVQVDDVTAAATRYVVSPIAGKVTKIYSVIDTALTGDLGITGKIGGTAITGGAITVTASGSAAGDVDTATPTAANVVAAGGAIELEFDGNPSAGGGAVATIWVLPSN